MWLKLGKCNGYFTVSTTYVSPRIFSVTRAEPDKYLSGQKMFQTKAAEKNWLHFDPSTHFSVNSYGFEYT
jgi:hypothetical protein